MYSSLNRVPSLRPSVGLRNDLHMTWQKCGSARSLISSWNLNTLTSLSAPRHRLRHTQIVEKRLPVMQMTDFVQFGERRQASYWVCGRSWQNCFHREVRIWAGFVRWNETRTMSRCLLCMPSKAEALRNVCVSRATNEGFRAIRWRAASGGEAT